MLNKNWDEWLRAWTLISTRKGLQGPSLYYLFYRISDACSEPKSAMFFSPKGFYKILWAALSPLKKAMWHRNDTNPLFLCTVLVNRQVSSIFKETLANRCQNDWKIPLVWCMDPPMGIKVPTWASRESSWQSHCTTMQFHSFTINSYERPPDRYDIPLNQH